MLLFSVTSQVTQLPKRNLDSYSTYIWQLGSIFTIFLSSPFLYLHILNSGYHYFSSGFISTVPPDSMSTLQAKRVFKSANHSFKNSSMVSCHHVFNFTWNHVLTPAYLYSCILNTLLPHTLHTSHFE